MPETKTLNHFDILQYIADLLSTMKVKIPNYSMPYTDECIMKIDAATESGKLTDEDIKDVYYGVILAFTECLTIVKDDKYIYDSIISVRRTVAQILAMYGVEIPEKDVL